MKDEWIKDIRHRMAEYETDAPGELWENIQARMPKPGMEKRKAKNSARVLWLKVIGTAAAILVAVAGGIGLLPDNESHNLKKTVALQQPQEAPPHGLHKAVGSATVISASPTDGGRRMETRHAPEGGKEDTEKPREEKTPVPQPEKTPVPQEDTPAPLPDEPDRQKPLPSHYRPQTGTHYAQAIPHSKKSGRISASVFTAGGLSASASGKSAPAIAMPVTVSTQDRWQDSPTLGILLYNQHEETENRTRHKLPVRTGFSLAYRLTPRWDIGTGLTYTLLHSDVKEGSKKHYFEGEQTLHYVGIMLNAKYRAFSWKKLDTYVSGGVLAEKRVSGKMERTYVLNGQVEKTETEEIRSRPFQFSANLGVGLQYNLTRAIGLYVEPGASYYFDDGSNIETIYQEKPLNFNLNLGLRFTLGNGGKR